MIFYFCEFFTRIFGASPEEKKYLGLESAPSQLQRQSKGHMENLDANQPIMSKVASVVSSWQSSEGFLQQKRKNQYFSKFKEPQGPLALAVNLAHIPVASTTETLQNSPDDAKNHPGIRTTFYIVKILYPGWSSVSSSIETKDHGKRGRDAAAAKDVASNEPKEKLSYMFKSEHAVMHSFSLVNQRGTYVRGGKSSECLMISPGMVITCRVWGNKFLAAFKDQLEDLNPMDVALVQFGLHSINSTAKDNGMMLEIKGYSKICGSHEGGLSNFHFIPSLHIPRSIEQATVQRSKFADATHISPGPLASRPQESPSTQVHEEDAPLPHQEIPGLNQEMMKNNLSSTSFFLSLMPMPANGSFGVGADDILRFFIQSPISDIPDTITSFKVLYSQNDFMFEGQNRGVSEADLRAWTIKLFNIASVMGILEMFVVLDTYASKKKQEEQIDDTDAYVRINTNLLIAKLNNPVMGSEVPCVCRAFSMSDSRTAETLSNLMVFSLPDESKIMLAIDVRKIERSLPSTSGEKPVVSTSLVHPLSAWTKGYGIYIFMEERLVHYFVASISSAGGNSSSGNGSGSAGLFDTVSAAVCMYMLGLESSDPSSQTGVTSTIQPPEAQKKKKKSTTE